jgi:DNA replication protein DnaC
MSVLDFSKINTKVLILDDFGFLVKSKSNRKDNTGVILDVGQWTPVIPTSEQSEALRQRKV